ncbi:MAG: hypothetical protein KKE52_07765, partial [Alphaproteobacteria bacterium]|nr:hypothetical protein [Alphaproteobacteria bacterium]
MANFIAFGAIGRDRAGAGGTGAATAAHPILAIQSGVISLQGAIPFPAVSSVITIISAQSISA